MAQVNWTSGAVEDLKSIAEYIAKDSVKYAKLQVLRIKHRTQILKSQVQIGKPVPEFNKKDIRELVEGNYRIIYKIVSAEQVDILTIHHSSRDLTKRKI
jgi:addiction module RelE/StbE family toxin